MFEEDVIIPRCLILKKEDERVIVPPSTPKLIFSVSVYSQILIFEITRGEEKVIKPMCEYTVYKI